MQEGAGLDPRISKIYNTWGLWWIVSEIWPPSWIRVVVGLALEELVTHRQTDRHCETLSPLALWAGGEKTIKCKFILVE